MAAYGSSSTSVLVDGYDLTPVLVETISRSTEAITVQSNPFGTASEAHTPVGLTKATLNLGGAIYDQAVDPLHPGFIADGGVGETRIVCITNEGQTKGKNFTGYAGAISTKSEAVVTNGALTKCNVSFVVSGAAEDGVILQELAAKTADWTTATSDAVDAADDPSSQRIAITGASLANPTVVTTTKNHGLVSGDVVAIFDMAGGITPDINDNPAAAEAWKLIGHTVTVTGDTTFTVPVNVSDNGTGGYCVVVQRAKGGAGYLQVTAGATFTNFVGKVQHSVDNSSWADLVTFADTTTDFSTAQRVATATATTAVRRYLAFDGNVTGAGSITVFAGFARGQ